MTGHPHTDPLLGATLLGQFELREVLGQGATGTVYRAWQAPMERWVAVKVLHPELADDPSMVARMAREARAVARLSHPGIVTVHATGTAPGARPFLVMELVDGLSLEDLLTDEPMQPARAVRLVRGIAGALVASHAAGVVHRDLKPANVMVVRDRDGERVVVLDFGIAKLLTSRRGLVDRDGQLTADGAICGTPHYIAPEQASGEAIDHRADIYSLGILLFRMVTGTLPFDGHPVAVLLGHVQDQPPLADEVCPAVGRRLAALIDRCLAKDPAARFATVEALVGALEEVARSLEPRWTEVAPTMAVDDAAAAALDFADRPPVRRSSRWMARIAALALAASVGAASSTLWQSSAPDARAAAGETAAPDPISDAPAELIAPRPDVISAPQGPPTRAIVVGEGGYSMRLMLPERLVVDVEYGIELEVWDPDGEVIDGSEMILTLDDPAGASRGVAARSTREAGRYRFVRSFASAGTYRLRVFPPAGGATIDLFFEVVEPGGDNS